MNITTKRFRYESKENNYLYKILSYINKNFCQLKNGKIKIASENSANHLFKVIFPTVVL